jgi:uncharacterized protein (DUF2062 family)
MNRVRNWVQAKVVQPVVTVIKAGITPHKLALSLAVGLSCGIFPIPGLTTLPVLAVAFAAGLNVPIAQVINLLVTPLNLMTVVPFKNLGESLLGAEPAPLSVADLASGLRVAPIATLRDTGAAIAHALFGWLVFFPVGTFLLYIAALPLTRALLKRYMTGAAQAAEKLA